jgi:hypothetical protein
MLKEPGEHAVHLPWVREARSRLRGVGFELLSQLVPIPTVYTPDFLTPVPLSYAPGIGAEPERLLATDPTVVRADLDRIEGELPPLVAEFRSDPEAGLARLAAEVRAYWDAALAPF